MAGEGISVVLHAMDCHPTSEEILTQACLVLGNIGRTGEVMGGGGEGLPWIVIPPGRRYLPSLPCR